MKNTIEIKKVVIKENNGGGISYEAYDGNDNIIAVIAGIEYQKPQPDYEQEARDLIAGEWSYSDASQWYDADGNSMGDRHHVEDGYGGWTLGDEIKAVNVVDDHDSTKILAIVTA